MPRELLNTLNINKNWNPLQGRHRIQAGNNPPPKVAYINIEKQTLCSVCYKKMHADMYLNKKACRCFELGCLPNIATYFGGAGGGGTGLSI